MPANRTKLKFKLLHHQSLVILELKILRLQSSVATVSWKKNCVPFSNCWPNCNQIEVPFIWPLETAILQCISSSTFNNCYSVFWGMTNYLFKFIRALFGMPKLFNFLQWIVLPQFCKEQAKIQSVSLNEYVILTITQAKAPTILTKNIWQFYHLSNCSHIKKLWINLLDFISDCFLYISQTTSSNCWGLFIRLQTY